MLQYERQDDGSCCSASGRMVTTADDVVYGKLSELFADARFNAKLLLSGALRWGVQSLLVAVGQRRDDH